MVDTGKYPYEGRTYPTTIGKGKTMDEKGLQMGGLIRNVGVAICVGSVLCALNGKSGYIALVILFYVFVDALIWDMMLSRTSCAFLTPIIVPSGRGEPAV